MDPPAETTLRVTLAQSCARAGGGRIREPEAAGIEIVSATLGRAEIGANGDLNIEEGIRDNIDMYPIEMSRITYNISPPLTIWEWSSIASHHGYSGPHIDNDICASHGWQKSSMKNTYVLTVVEIYIRSVRHLS